MGAHLDRRERTERLGGGLTVRSRPDGGTTVEAVVARRDYDADLVCFESRSLFPEGVETGMAFEGLPEGSATEGMPADRVYTVTEVYPTHVVLDGNHPLAGMALRIQLKVLDVREATEEETAQGSVGEPLLSVQRGDGPLH